MKTWQEKVPGYLELKEVSQQWKEERANAEKIEQSAVCSCNAGDPIDLSIISKKLLNLEEKYPKAALIVRAEQWLCSGIAEKRHAAQKALDLLQSGDDGRAAGKVLCNW